MNRENHAQPRVFVLGDSQGFTDFGPTLQKELVRSGYEVLYHAVKNGTPYYWSGLWDSPVLTRCFPPANDLSDLGSPTLQSMAPQTMGDYVRAYQPDVFVIQAGTNFEIDLARDNPDQISLLIRKCLEEAASGGAKVLWIGPPDVRDDVRTPEFQKLAIGTLEKALAPWSESQGRSCFLDSRPICPMSNQARGDGEHPENQLARDWATAAARWVGESIEHFRTRKLLRCQDGAEEGTRKPEAIRDPGCWTRTGGASYPRRTLPMRLRLSSKSLPTDLKSLPYTDAFSVFRYELINPEEIYGFENHLTRANSEASDSGRFWVYVLHWVVHNPGSGPQYTLPSCREEGSEVFLEVARVEEHPLGEALMTMPQTNPFDDFLAPVFVSKHVMDERAPAPKPDLVMADGEQREVGK